MTSKTALAILTYQRNYLLKRQLRALASWHEKLAEVLVVDNANETSTRELCREFPWVKLIQAKENLGAAGRNLAFDAVKAEYLVTLDDDVLQFNAQHIDALETLFKDSTIACINFKVVEEHTGKLVNWVHHRDARKYSNVSFDTYEVTEGAAAFRSACLKQVGGYPQSFFLSHEGPDLAWRLMDAGWRVTYCPEIAVMHLFAPEGRASWRNYYYDTRNTLWLVLRHLPVLYGLRLLCRQNMGMIFYSLRDGFFGTWLRAWGDALRGAPEALRERQRLKTSTLVRLKEIDTFRPAFLEQVLLKLRSSDQKLTAS